MVPLTSSVQTEGDDVVIMPNQLIEPRPNIFSPTIKFLEIKFNNTGDGVYFHLQFNNTVRVYIINRSIYEYYTFEGGEINSSVAVNGMTFLADNTVDFQYVVPYDDRFYFFVTNNHDSFVIWEGWYAKDITVPTGSIWGITSGQSFVKGEQITIGCYYEADRFNITSLIFSLDIYPYNTENINTDGPINWTVELDTNKLIGFGSTYINFTIVDSLGNFDSLIIYIFIINPNPTSPPIPEPNLFMIYMIISLLGCLVVAGVVVSYRNMKIEQNEQNERRKKENERPYHKGHRDSKPVKKRKKKWDQ